MSDLDLLETLARAAAAMAEPQADRRSIDRLLQSLPSTAGLPCRLWLRAGALEVDWQAPPTPAQEAFVDVLSSCVSLAVNGASPAERELLDASGFAAETARAVAAARWRGQAVSVAVFEVSGLVLAPGFDGGSAVSEVGQLAIGTTRQSDAVGHLGGGRFALLFPQAGSFEARAAFRRVREALAAADSAAADLSCGAAGFAELEDGESAEALVAAAVERLSAARLRRAYTAPTDPTRPLAS
jgi:hypothetical protein